MDNWVKDPGGPSLPKMRIRGSLAEMEEKGAFFLPSRSILRKIYDTICDLTCFTYQK